MKYVKEYINEKFTEDSDPIKDMGIGFKDEFKPNTISKNYAENIKNELKKIMYKERRKIMKECKKKLLGKIITGRFIDILRWSWTDKSFRVKKIKINFSSSFNNQYVRSIQVYSTPTKLYELDNSETYKITM